MWEHFQQSKEHNMHESLIARDCFFYIVQSMSMDVPHVKGYQASMRSIAESSEGLIAPSVAPSVCLEERRRDVRSCADSFAPSVAPSECLEERRRDVRTIADSFAPSVAPSECLEERRRDVRTIAHHKRSIALECKHCSRSCRKSNTQYGKILEISPSPLPARNVTLKVCRRKE
jgi:hypothetical protein